jgi:hypothetical protein
MTFDTHIGIDYSGAETPVSRLAGLQVYASTGNQPPEQICSPLFKENRPCNWTRQEIAQWLTDTAKGGHRFIAGIDHAFSFPRSYFHRYRLKTWDAFLVDFCKPWPTHEPHVFIDRIRDEGPKRTGSNDEFRLTERWTSSAKSVFQFDVRGQVAKSTHAGIPWLHYIRQQAKGLVHVWPFDGWAMPKDKCVIVEVYPSIFSNRYPPEDRRADQHDAYVVARWLSDMDRRDSLDRCFHPALTEDEQQVADLEGWILGIA